MDELATHRVELQQVQAALAMDPNNEDLKKLESDLKDIIALTSQLVEETDKPKKPTGAGGKEWKVGDTCEAVWAEDGNYYKAVIKEILPLSEDGTQQCSVEFSEYGNKDVVAISSLRASKQQDTGGGDKSKKRPLEDDGVVQQGKSKAEREAERERKKKKREKKERKLEEKNKEAEMVQSSWQKFNNGRSAKSKTGFLKGKAKESIFKSPDTVDGKVGVGTCGIAGKGMTDFKRRDKWTYK